jgi:hypothetical protein
MKTAVKVLFIMIISFISIDYFILTIWVNLSQPWAQSYEHSALVPLKAERFLT